jgi:myo-inositol-1(or 4)-monophosphatase
MLEFAIDLAERGGQLLLDLHRQGKSGAIRTKESQMDLVTAGDLAVERLIIDSIRMHHPNHAIHSEESAQGAIPDAAWVWLTDPLDGTTNFAHGLPLYSVNIALAYQGRPVLGVTHAPALGCTYWAERGSRAWTRERGIDRRTRVTTTGEVENAILATGFPYDRAMVKDNNLAEFTSLELKVHAVRCLGSAALDMAWVAAGLLDGYWESRAHNWDWAAGTVLVEEAGGKVSDFAGASWEPHSRCVIASNGRMGVHEGIRTAIAAARVSAGLAGL